MRRFTAWLRGSCTAATSNTLSSRSSAGEEPERGDPVNLDIERAMRPRRRARASAIAALAPIPLPWSVAAQSHAEGPSSAGSWRRRASQRRCSCRPSADPRHPPPTSQPPPRLRTATACARATSTPRASPASSSLAPTRPSTSRGGAARQCARSRRTPSPRAGRASSRSGERHLHLLHAHERRRAAVDRREAGDRPLARSVDARVVRAGRAQGRPPRDPHGVLRALGRRDGQAPVARSGNRQERGSRSAALPATASPSAATSSTTASAPGHAALVRPRHQGRPASPRRATP